VCRSGGNDEKMRTLSEKAFRVGGPARPVHGPLDGAQFFPGVEDCRAQLFVPRLTLIDADDSDGAGPNVQAGDAGAGLPVQQRQASMSLKLLFAR
jgi:hypothetical protein